MAPSQVDEVLSKTKPSVRKAFGPLYDLLVDELGCAVSARPEYVTFSLGSEMVAAAHPQPDAIDVALAIPFDPKDKKLFDALDYKWRSLPAGISVTTSASARSAMTYARDAAARVTAGETLTTAGEAYARPAGTYQPAFKKFRKR